MRFADRTDAGRLLADALTGRIAPDAVVLGLPRGGVVVGAPVAAALHAPLDVLVVRKLGLPERPELAMGAIAAIGDRVETVRNREVLAAAGVDDAAFAAVRERELVELRRRTAAYRGNRPAVPVGGRTVVLVDDGLATGSTVRAALAALRGRQPARVVVAVPVGSPDVVARLAREVDELICLSAPAGFRAVGQAYAAFPDASDDAVRAALAR